MGTLWPKNWKFHHYNIVAMSRFVLITRSIFDLTTCAIPLCKALTDGFISSMTPKNSDQVMGRYDPKTENFIITIYHVLSSELGSILGRYDLNWHVPYLCVKLWPLYVMTQNWKFHHYNVVWYIVWQRHVPYLCVKLWPMASFRLWHLRTPTKLWDVMTQNWKFHHYNIVAICCFVLITRLILDLTTCAIPLCKALTDGFISSMTPKNSDQVMGRYDPKTENFIITMVLAMSRFVLITRSILDLTTCVPLCKALTDGFILSMTPKNSDQVMGRYDPKTENFIITMVLQCLVLSS